MLTYISLTYKVYVYGRVQGHLINFISYCESGSKKFEKLSLKDFLALSVDSGF